MDVNTAQLVSFL